MKKIVIQIKYVLRQLIKLCLQSLFLPFVYFIFSFRNVQTGKVIFADAHHEIMPYPMQRLYDYMKSKGYNIQVHCTDYQKKSFLHVFGAMMYFVKEYATAEYVVICDNFLPVSSCRKRKQTKVVQLWHAGGVLKKYGYDTPDDIPKFYFGNVYKNYDITTVSSKECIPVYEKAMRLKPGTVYATGLSKTDNYYDELYLEDCKKIFYQKYPEAIGKKIILWAPTFRGKAMSPYLVGDDAITRMEQELKEKYVQDEYYVIRKAHPHIDAKNIVSNCDIPTDRLFAVADILISDCSSTIYDYILLNKPLLIFVPDLAELEEKRGFYIPLTELPGTMVVDGEQLAKEVVESLTVFDQERMTKFVEKYMGMCDGHATERIYNLITNAS